MLRDQAQALLLISVDSYSVGNPLSWLTNALEMVPGGGTDPISEAVRDGINSATEAFNLSDIKIPALRIPIPIMDGIIQIHQVGTQSHHNLGVTNQEVSTTTATGEAVAPEGGKQGFILKNVFRPGSNNVQLQFEMKNNLRKLSTLVDILTQVSNSMASRTVNVAYFSETMCIFESTLIGINRASVNGTDKEIVTITLERPTDDEERLLEQAKKEAQPIQGLEIKAGASVAAPAAAPMMMRAMAATAMVMPPAMEATVTGTPEIKRGYLFYRVASVEELEKIPVTDFTSTETVQRQTYRLFRIVSESVNNPRRNMIGIVYDGQMVTLPNTSPSAYQGDIGLVRVDDVFYLGVKS